MSLADAFENNRAAIAAQVRDAIAQEPIPAQDGISLATTFQARDNGSVTLRQLGEVVTLTKSQVEYLHARIGHMVRAAS